MCVGVLIESRSADNHGASSSGVNNTTEASLEKELPNGVIMVCDFYIIAMSVVHCVFVLCG